MFGARPPHRTPQAADRLDANRAAGRAPLTQARSNTQPRARGPRVGWAYVVRASSQPAGRGTRQGICSDANKPWWTTRDMKLGEQTDQPAGRSRASRARAWLCSCRGRRAARGAQRGERRSDLPGRRARGSGGGKEKGPGQAMIEGATPSRGPALVSLSLPLPPLDYLFRSRHLLTHSIE